MTTTTTNQKSETGTIAAHALQTAQGQIGQQEVPKGSNAGPMVDKYLQSVGLRPGFAWCQAFVYWCFEQAAAQLGKANPVVKTGGVYNCWNKTPDVHKVLKSNVMQHPELVEPGMQFVLLFGRGVGHTGIVESVDAVAQTFATIEGNSNTNGGREGYEVVRHVRHMNEPALQGFIKYV